MTTAAADPRIDQYLARVRVALRGLPEVEIEDILRELHSHTIELAEQRGGTVEFALQSLGDPDDLAGTYRSETQMARAECSGSPIVILQGLRLTTRSGLGRVSVTALYAFAYINVLALWAAAIDKLFAPSRVGLWHVPGKIWPLALVTNGNAPEGAHELLGWGLVPVAALVGWIVRVVTDRIARWWIGRFRRANATRGV